MKKQLLAITLSCLTFGVSALNLQPSATAESELYPASNHCKMGKHTTKTPEAYAYQGGYQVEQGYMMYCNLPVKPGRYVERIVFDHFAYGMNSRGCKVGFVRAASGGTVTNSMTLARDGNVDVWYYDNLGSSQAYTGGNPHNTLLLRCEHWNFVNGSYIRYGVIRVDYTGQ